MSGKRKLNSGDIFLLVVFSFLIAMFIVAMMLVFL